MRCASDVCVRQIRRKIQDVEAIVVSFWAAVLLHGKNCVWCQEPAGGQSCVIRNCGCKSATHNVCEVRARQTWIEAARRQFSAMREFVQSGTLPADDANDNGDVSCNPTLLCYKCAHCGVDDSVYNSIDVLPLEDVSEELSNLESKAVATRVASPALKERLDELEEACDDYTKEFTDATHILEGVYSAATRRSE